MAKENLIHELLPVDVGSAVALPFADGGIPAGFPSPAQDYMHESIDLNQEIVKHKETTFYARVAGDSMVGVGIYDGDLLVIDRSIEAKDGDLIVAYIDGEFTVKTLQVDAVEDCMWLVPANRKYRKIKVTRDNDFIAWGVVTHSIRVFRR